MLFWIQTIFSVKTIQAKTHIRSYVCSENMKPLSPRLRQTSVSNMETYVSVTKPPLSPDYDKPLSPTWRPMSPSLNPLSPQTTTNLCLQHGDLCLRH